MNAPVTTAPGPAKAAADPATALIDCDVHCEPASRDAVTRRLPRAYRELGYGKPGHLGHANPHGVARRDAAPPGGGPPGSDPDLVLAHCLGERPGFVVLTPSVGYGVGVHPNPDFAAAWVAATNDWIAEEWLPRDPRLRAMLCVAPSNPDAAAAEVRRLADHPRFVGVICSAATQQALGHRSHWPLFEAAEAAGLPIGFHPGQEGTGATRPFATGFAETYFEWHSSLSSVYIPQVIGLVARGVLTRFPELKFVAIEGGFAWLPHAMWRMDKNWKALRATVPYLTEPPSFYVKRQLRLTTQPIEEPDRSDHLLQVFDMIDAGRTLMYSSDYPHWDGDDPRYTLPRKLDEATRRRILFDNAAELYGLSLDDLAPSRS